MAFVRWKHAAVSSKEVLAVWLGESSFKHGWWLTCVEGCNMLLVACSFIGRWFMCRVGVQNRVLFSFLVHVGACTFPFSFAAIASDLWCRWGSFFWATGALSIWDSSFHHDRNDVHMRGVVFFKNYSFYIYHSFGGAWERL
ncbi:hypothetical protein DEO72_LG4g1168 [Vigna unguiculata]|uniref:Transmembrane protein n=1 Tax=Vigna unguiculata TaxID=3917 RepID=A0A4D6LP31_VIGUN|nr:hypothetical protein DEO72_LG4g1168 [Vigna unguiculata]